MNEHMELDVLDELALGTLDALERPAIETHLATCATCRRAYDDVRSVIDVLPHELEVAAPSDELRERILRAIDARSSATSSSPAHALRPRSFQLAVPLAAALLLALLGDVYLALRTLPNGEHIAALTALQPTSLQPRVTPAPSTSPRKAAPRHGADAEAARIAALQRQLADARSTAQTDAQQIAHLERELERAPRFAQPRALPPRVSHSVITPAPHPGRTAAALPQIARTAGPRPIAAASTSPGATDSAAASGVSPDDASLIGALRTGKVYAIDGVVDGEPWHLTIVQPRSGGNAVIYSGTPGAPAGQTYRTWVLRGGRTVTIGELPPATPTTLEMPMALEAGDVVAFSREPVGPTNGPTQPFLMQFKVSP